MSAYITAFSSRSSSQAITALSRHPIARWVIWIRFGNIPLASMRRIVRMLTPTIASTSGILKIRSVITDFLSSNDMTRDDMPHQCKNMGVSYNFIAVGAA